MSKKKNQDTQRYRKPKKDISVKPITEGQKDYLASIMQNDVTICSGPPGSGKTAVAIGSALMMLKYERDINKIIAVRPAVSVYGENLGFLPGDIDDKMNPYIAPIRDNMGIFLDQSEIQSLLLNGGLEVVPIAFMRGRQFNHCVIIFDEAQNATPEQMKMFLTRIGFNCKAIIEGDVSQSDLRLDDNYNGLIDAIGRFDGLEGVGVISMGKRDIVRSPIVSRILSRYE